MVLYLVSKAVGVVNDFKHCCLPAKFGLNSEILALIWAESGVIITNYPCRIEWMRPEDLSNHGEKTFAFAKRLVDRR